MNASSGTLAAQQERRRAEARDLFARAALTGLLACPHSSYPDPEAFAKRTYEYADAMMAARGES